MTLSEVKQKEEDFHDKWAESEDLHAINVRQMNEACTAPEMRYITKTLGDIKGKELLDVGCGLGEASVYFALLGAKVTATDISGGMVEAAGRLAEINGTSILTHKSATEDLQLPKDKKFDIIYVGNLFHHVDIDQAIGRLKPHLKSDGIMISWDPVAYNPIINVYRKMAMEVRTEDEHPFTLSDIRKFRKHFATVDTKWFWFSTLTIFILMALVQRRNPNNERFWKKVVDEGDSWAWLYKPLELFDSIVLGLLPFLRPLCWNVVLTCRGPKS